MFHKYLFLLVIWVALSQSSQATEAPTAADWRADCAGFIDTLRGTGDGDDLGITYCVGQTQGILAGLEMGSRIGALSMASRLTVVVGLNKDAVFEVFESMTAKELLGVCVPDGERIGSQVKVIADYLDQNPEAGSLPVTALFFKALEGAYPCAPGAPQEGEQH